MVEEATVKSGRMSVRVNALVLERATQVCAGLSLPVAVSVSLLLEEIVRTRRVPNFGPLNKRLAAEAEQSEKVVFSFQVKPDSKDALWRLLKISDVSLARLIEEYFGYIATKRRVPVTLCLDDEQAASAMRRQRISYYEYAVVELED